MKKAEKESGMNKAEPEEKIVLVTTMTSPLTRMSCVVIRWGENEAPHLLSPDVARSLAYGLLGAAARVDMDDMFSRIATEDIGLEPAQVRALMKRFTDLRNASSDTSRAGDA